MEDKDDLLIKDNLCPLCTDFNKNNLKLLRNITQENFFDLNEKFNLKIGKIVYLPEKKIFLISPTLTALIKILSFKEEKNADHF